ncbi:hypothetical protein J7K52_00200 [Candidatus Bathyarchaeota archaeon]|nr:hypothetical protein [Candidatus Bathyarchaeota archaeon]
MSSSLKDALQVLESRLRLSEYTLYKWLVEAGNRRTELIFYLWRQSTPIHIYRIALDLNRRVQHVHRDLKRLRELEIAEEVENGYWRLKRSS